MGKKRSSKTSKKKQAKAAKSSVIRKHLTATSTFGIPVTKASSTSTGAAKKKQNALPNTFRPKPKNLRPSQQRQRPNSNAKQWHAPHVNDGAKKISSSRTKTTLDQEQRDFEQEYASLRERQANDAASGLLLSRKNRRNGPKPRRDMNFAPSGLRLDDATRSTDELLTEATDRLASDSIGIAEDGGRGSIAPQPMAAAPMEHVPKVNLLQSMASQIRLEERLRKLAEGEKDGANEMMQNNKYWALQEDDSEEENGTVDRSAKFRFTPASFSIPTSTTPCAGGATYGNVGFALQVAADDPDL